MADDDQQQGIPPWSGWFLLARPQDYDLAEKYRRENSLAPYAWPSTGTDSWAAPSAPLMQESLSSISDADLLRYYDIWRRANDPRFAPPQAPTSFGGGLPAYGALAAAPRSFDEVRPQATPANNSGDAPPFDEWQMLREEAARRPITPPAMIGGKPDIGYTEAFARGGIHGINLGFEPEFEGLRAAGKIPGVDGRLWGPLNPEYMVGLGRLGIEQGAKLLGVDAGDAAATELERRRDQVLEQYRTAQEQYPWTTLAGDVVGSAALPGGSGFLPRVGISAAKGAIAGYNDGENPNDARYGAGSGGMAGFDASAITYPLSLFAHSVPREIALRITEEALQRGFKGVADTPTFRWQSQRDRWREKQNQGSHNEQVDPD